MSIFAFAVLASIQVRCMAKVYLTSYRALGFEGDRASLEHSMVDLGSHAKAWEIEPHIHTMTFGFPFC